MPEPQATDASTMVWIHTPRAGELTTGWRIVTACTWIAVIVAFAAVWNTSVQLGLSTWWLGARAEPQPPIVRLSPFLVPLAHGDRRLRPTLVGWHWLGIGAAAVTAVFGIGDLGRVQGLATLELLIAGIALMVSLASFDRARTGGRRHLTT